MADDKQGRDDQAHDAERRRRERYLAADLERGDEAEPPLGPGPDELPEELTALEFPATGAEVVAVAGHAEVRIEDRALRVESLVPDSDAETFESPAEVAVRLERPSVATVMKRVAEAAGEVQGVRLKGSQRDTYEKTLRAVDAIEPDELEALGEWVVEELRESGSLPGSRSVRREAAKRCRAAGHSISSDDWLGI